MAATAVLTAAAVGTTLYTTQEQKKAAKALKPPPVPKPDTPDASAIAGQRKRRLAGIPSPTQLSGPLGVTAAAPGAQKTLLGG